MTDIFLRSLVLGCYITARNSMMFCATIGAAIASHILVLYIIIESSCAIDMINIPSR